MLPDLETWPLCMALKYETKRQHMTPIFRHIIIVDTCSTISITINTWLYNKLHQGSSFHFTMKISDGLNVHRGWYTSHVAQNVLITQRKSTASPFSSVNLVYSSRINTFDKMIWETSVQLRTCKSRATRSSVVGRGTRRKEGIWKWDPTNRRRAGSVGPSHGTRAQISRETWTWSGRLQIKWLLSPAAGSHSVPFLLI